MISKAPTTAKSWILKSSRTPSSPISFPPIQKKLTEGVSFLNWRMRAAPCFSPELSPAIIRMDVMGLSLGNIGQFQDNVKGLDHNKKAICHKIVELYKS